MFELLQSCANPRPVDWQGSGIRCNITKQEVLHLQRNWPSYFTLYEEKKLSLKNLRVRQLYTYSNRKGILQSVTVNGTSLHCHLLGRSLHESFLPIEWTPWTVRASTTKQRGFRKGRETNDMIFTARQLQEKCQEKNADLYIAFVDLTKEFDSQSWGTWRYNSLAVRPSS